MRRLAARAIRRLGKRNGMSNGSKVLCSLLLAYFCFWVAAIANYGDSMPPDVFSAAWLKAAWEAYMRVGKSPARFWIELFLVGSPAWLVFVARNNPKALKASLAAQAAMALFLLALQLRGGRADVFAYFALYALVCVATGLGVILLNLYTGKAEVSSRDDAPGDD